MTTPASSCTIPKGGASAESPAEAIERIAWEYGVNVDGDGFIAALHAAGFKIMAREPTGAMQSSLVMCLDRLTYDIEPEEAAEMLGEVWDAAP